MWRKNGLRQEDINFMNQVQNLDLMLMMHLSFFLMECLIELLKTELNISIELIKYILFFVIS